MRALAARGPRALLEPPLADEIIARTRAEPRPGTLAAADFAAYQPRVGEPLCRPTRIYVVCVPPPPSSGVALLQLLAILEHTDIAARRPSDPQAWFLFAEASRLMYADRDPTAMVRSPDSPGWCGASIVRVAIIAGSAP